MKGHRSVVGAWDGEHLLYVFAVVNMVTAAVHANTLESPKGAMRKTGKSKWLSHKPGFGRRNRSETRYFRGLWDSHSLTWDYLRQWANEDDN